MKHNQQTQIRRVQVSGAGCLRVDRYGTLTVDGQPVIPLLAASLARQGAGETRPFAGRVTIVVELWARPMQARPCPRPQGRRGGGK